MGRSLAVFGALWLLTALGFVAAAAALVAGFGWGAALLVAVTLLSLLLTVLDWNAAFVGGIVNLVILAVLFVGPRLASLHP